MCTRFFRRDGLYVNRPIKKNFQLEGRASLPLPRPRFIFLIHTTWWFYLSEKKNHFCKIKNSLILCFHRIVKTSLKQITRKEIAHRRVNIKHCAPEQKLKKKQQQNAHPHTRGRWIQCMKYYSQSMFFFSNLVISRNKMRYLLSFLTFKQENRSQSWQIMFKELIRWYKTE